MLCSPRFSSTAEKFMASTNGCNYEKEDRISDLPHHIIDYIFDRMTVCDAARTTILSSKWRHVWAAPTKLAFDENFFQEFLIGREQSIQYEFTKTIGKVLSFHSGPIFKFILYIPDIPNLYPEIDHWMLFLSRNGIKELEIDNASLTTPYIVPSDIFSCSLSNLKLRNCSLCELKPPYNEFEGFRHLVNLELVRVLFCATTSVTLLQNAPMLKKLAIVNCTGVEHMYWQWVANKKQLKYVRIEIGREVKNVEPTVNMMEFLKDILKVGELYLDGFSLECFKYLGTSNPCEPQDLIHSSITHITIRNLKADQIPCLLWLLKHCPSLMSLQLKMGASGRNNIIPVAKYLEQSNWLHVNLDMLQTVSIRMSLGDKAVLLLIKLLLARSTCLQKMIIEQYTCDDGFGISGQLSSFPRASSCSEIIYQHHKFILSDAPPIIYVLCFVYVAGFLFQCLSQLF